MYVEKLASVCLLTRHDGKVLAISRGEDLSNLGLPGGKVEVGESRKHAALRELEEETGFKARMSDATLLFEGGNHGVHVTAFRISKWSGDLIERHREGTPMWVDPAELLSPKCSYREFNLSVLKVCSLSPP